MNIVTKKELQEIINKRIISFKKQFAGFFFNHDEPLFRCSINVIKELDNLPLLLYDDIVDLLEDKKGEKS